MDKQHNNYINDINNGVYTNNSLTLVNFDLGQIYNSQKFTESSELFAVLPIAMVAGLANSTQVLVNPTERSQALCSIKSDFLNLIHEADIVVKGEIYRAMSTFHQHCSALSINLRNV